MGLYTTCHQKDKAKERQKVAFHQAREEDSTGLARGVTNTVTECVTVEAVRRTFRKVENLSLREKERM